MTRSRCCRPSPASAMPTARAATAAATPRARARPGCSPGRKGGCRRELRQPDPHCAGGTHEAGLKAGVFEAVKSFAEHHGLLPRGVQLRQEDVCGRMSSCSRAHPRSAVPGPGEGEAQLARGGETVSHDAARPFEVWLNAHVEHGKTLAELAAKRRRAGSSRRRRWRRRSSHRWWCCRASCPTPAVPTRRATNCSWSRAIPRRLRKQARDRETQAILPCAARC